jgi:hypothetical protein
VSVCEPVHCSDAPSLTLSCASCPADVVSSDVSLVTRLLQRLWSLLVSESLTAPSCRTLQCGMALLCWLLCACENTQLRWVSGDVLYPMLREALLFQLSLF